MSAPVTIFGASDVAEYLGVGNSAVSNYLARHDDTPPPAFVTGDGRRFWDASGVAAWRRWFDRDRSYDE